MSVWLAFQTEVPFAALGLTFFLAQDRLIHLMIFRYISDSTRFIARC